MFGRAIAIGLVAVGLLASPATAGGVLRGRGPTAQAWMDAALLQKGTGPVQVLSELCENPPRLRRCSPISSVLQRALEQVIARRITWVTHRRVNGSQFWVFAPVAFHRDRASSEYAWWDPGDLGCYGGTALSWDRYRGAWSAVAGASWIGCAAT